MTTSDVNKLSSYCLDCVKSAGRSSGFNNLKNVIVTNDTEFKADNKAINDMMMSYALNKSTMSLLYGRLFLEGQRGRDVYYSPLLYTDAELVRNGDIIRLEYDEDALTVNVGLIASLLGKDSDIIEATINQLLEIEEPQNIDFKSVLRGLVPDLKGLRITDKQGIILAKSPESTAGLMLELKRIISEY